LSGAVSGRLGVGQKIGYVERLLIFIFVLCGSIEAIGFLITAKSILRFSESSKDKQYAEYVLLGTLLSYLLALIVALATRYAQSSLGLVGVA
jgi:ABC-type proline/glycine betaine transport system permease subunit